MDNINNTIALTLEVLGINADSIDPRIMEHLVIIEEILTEIFNNHQQLLIDIKLNKPSKLKITSTKKISRQTIYNNPNLKHYIEKRIEEFDVFFDIKKNERFSSRISDLEGMVKRMEERDVNEELQNHKINTLQNELKLRKKQNVEFKERYNNAVKQINQMRLANLK